MSETKPVIFSENGLPFKNEQECKSYMKEHALDPKEWFVTRMQDGTGFCIASPSALMRVHVSESVSMPSLAKGEKFKWVRFANARDANDFPHIVQVINGVTFIITRGRVFPASESMISHFRNAVHHKYDTESQGPLIELGVIDDYPFEIVSDGRADPTEEDFKRFLGEGTAVRNEANDRRRRELQALRASSV